MKKQEMVNGFNRWMDEFIEDPEKFKETQGLIKSHLSERAGGISPTYGELCVATLTRCATNPK